MAYGDWKFTKRGPGTFLNGTLTDGEDGGPRLNSSLSDPLTGSGDFCREYALTVFSTARVVAEISSSVSGGLFTEVPNTKAISVRASLRSSNTALANTYVGIGAKLDEDGQSSTNYSPRGYGVFLGDDNTVSGGDKLVLSMRDAAFVNKSVVMSGTYASDTWHHVRMDVTPIGTIRDRIEVYTGSAEGGNSWELVHTEIVLNSDPHYIPWGESGEGEIGYFVNISQTATEKVHIDNFEAYVVDV